MIPTYDLMSYRIHKFIVASPYDAFILEQDEINRVNNE